jgi:hypothetical protein
MQPADRERVYAAVRLLDDDWPEREFARVGLDLFAQRLA